MRLTDVLGLRRILNSSYHPFVVIPKPSLWPRRERLRRFVAWQYGSSRDTVRRGSKALIDIFCYSDIKRKDERNLLRHYSEERLHAALDLHHTEYKVVRGMLTRAHIHIDNTILSQLAIYEPRTFKSIVLTTKAMSEKEGRPVVEDEETKTVDVRDSWFREPLPIARVYQRGPASNHKQKPQNTMFFKAFINSIAKNKRRQYDDCQALKIDSDLLCCPVCYNIFVDDPRILVCGHTFCQQCLNHLTTSSVDTLSYQCPICRIDIKKNARIPMNFQLKSILHSIDEWVDSDTMNQHSDSNSYRVAGARLKKKYEETMTRNCELQLEQKELCNEINAQKRYLVATGTALICVLIYSIFFRF
ncbi:hypothetical protein M3Y95_00578600 [Aphelenchoides besseyi]|nr:hypothetical protein M3Y95_00578600 [Aphelenchoides besseyi]